MRTTLNLDGDLLEEVVKETGETNRGKALNQVMAEYIRQRRVNRLLAMRGKLDLRSRDEWHEKDLELELEHLKERQW
jgi:hypothetical protein